MSRVWNTSKYTKVSGSKRVRIQLDRARPAGVVEKSCATGFGAARISNDETYRGSWEWSRQSQYHLRPKPPPPPGDNWKEILIDRVKIGGLWRELGFSDLVDDVQACLLSTWKEGTRKKCGSHLRRFGFFYRPTPAEETQKVVGEDLLLLFKFGYRPATLRGAVSDLKAVRLLGWIPDLGWDRLWHLAKALVATKGERAYAGPHVVQTMVEPCSTPTDWSIFAVAAISFVPPSAAQVCVLVRSRTGGSRDTTGGSQGKWGVTSGSVSSGSGRRTWVVKSSSAAHLTWKRARLASSRAPYTLATAGTIGDVRVQRSCDGGVSPGATCAGGDVGPMSEWPIGMLPPPMSLSFTRFRDCHGWSSGIRPQGETLPQAGCQQDPARPNSCSVDARAQAVEDLLSSPRGIRWLAHASKGLRLTFQALPLLPSRL